MVGGEVAVSWLWSISESDARFMSDWPAPSTGPTLASMVPMTRVRLRLGVHADGSESEHESRSASVTVGRWCKLVMRMSRQRRVSCESDNGAGSAEASAPRYNGVIAGTGV